MATSAEPNKESPPRAPAAAPGAHVVAVVDIGSTSLRMEIAEVSPEGEVRTLESLQQPVLLGKDTFARGRIEQSTIEDSVNILKGFRRVMEEYGVTDPSQIRAVATSAVREAANRDTFLDRVYMATRINIEPIEEAEEIRLTYLAVQSLLQREPDLQKSDALVVEVGGGDSEVLLVQGGNVTFSNTFRHGTLRMREYLETRRAPAQKLAAILARQIQLAVDQIKRNIPISRVPLLIAVSRDAMFAAAQLSSKWADQRSARFEVKNFTAFAKKISNLSPDDLVKQHRTTYQDAETAGAALLTYAQLARVFQAEHIVVPKSSLRQGLIQEFAISGPWTRQFADQVEYSAIALGAKYAFDEKHARQVARLSRMLFHELQPEHQLGPRFELLLHSAALLHEIGSFISSRSHHKHSMYLILNSDLFGLNRHDTSLIALVARYHRRAMPQPYHEVYSTLNRDDRLAVSKMAAILRVADALDRNNMQQARDITFIREKGQFHMIIRGMDDLTLERLALREKGAMFEEVYGLTPVVRGDTSQEGPALNG